MTDRRVNIGLSRTKSFADSDQATLNAKREPERVRKKELKSIDDGTRILSLRDKPSASLSEITSVLMHVAEELMSEDVVRGNREVPKERYPLNKPGIELGSVGRNRRTVLHHILDRMQSAIGEDGHLDMLRTVPQRVRDYLEWLIIQYPDLLSHNDGDNVRPLESAASKVSPVVFVVMDLVLSKSELESLSTKKCAVKTKGRTEGTCNLKLSPSLISAFEKEGLQNANACLHDRLDIERLQKWMKKMRDTIIPEALKPKGQTGQSTTILHTLLDKNSFTKDNHPSRTAGFQRLIELCPPKTFETLDGSGFCPLHKAIQLYGEDDIDFDRLYNVIESLIKVSPDSIYHEKSGSGNPYSLLLEWRPNRPFPATSGQSKDDSWQKVERLLKYTCIGDTADRDKKTTYLYGGVKNAKQTYLDLPFDGMNKEFMIRLCQAVSFQFETVLEYVSIRRDRTQPKPQHLLPLLGNDVPKDRNPYQGVFEALRGEGVPDEFRRLDKVEKIFKVVVDDLVPYPHTDSAIKSALKPFEVEIWDWQKLDISSQVILDTASGTRKLTLHSSGNEAVLRSWSCKHGLVQLTKLESITVVMYPDLRDTRDGCKKSFDEFQTAICRRKPTLKNKIVLEWADGTGVDQGFESPEAMRENHRSLQEPWRETLAPYVNMLKDYANKEVEVKIALLDNGVKYDDSKDNIPIERGVSYYGDRHPAVPFRDFFAGPSEHGTKMASFIYDVCPMAKIYAVRMDDSGQDKYTVDSAIKAVQWAREMEVDIISMSWTFEKKDATANQITDFTTAINEAANQGILLFNSLDDKMKPENIKEIYPLHLDTIIRVGSATKWGEKSGFSKPTTAHYLFPGEDVKITEAENKFASGSSVATAFAAGLAGLIIYSQRLLRYLNNRTAQESKGLTRTKKADIEQAFNVLAGQPDETMAKDLYVGLGSHFEKDPSKILDETGGPEKVLENLMLKLKLPV